MNIFNSLGSNYDLKFVLKALFAPNDKKYSGQLKAFLEEKYSGQVTLLYKGREAIELGLQLLDLPKGSEVAINGFTCFAVYQAITDAGLKVEYLDIGPSDLNFSARSLEEKLKSNPKIKAVIIQNTLGYPAEIEDIAKVCKAKNIILIEDLAHSIGTIYSNGQEAGTVGDLVVLSFSQDKVVDGISGGGLVLKGTTGIKGITSTTGFEEVGFWQQLKDRFYPRFTYRIRKTYPLEIGKVFHVFLKKFNLLSVPMGNQGNGLHKLPGWYCYLINLQFDDLSQNLKHRKSIASIYAQNLPAKITLPSVLKTIPNSTNLRFPILVENRNSLIDYLKGVGIYVSDIWYDAPIAPKKYLGLTDYQSDCPNAEILADKILNLPTHREVSEKDALKISERINQWLKSQ